MRTINFTYFYNKYYRYKFFNNFKSECIINHRRVWYLKFTFDVVVLWSIWQIEKYDIQNKRVMDISIFKLNFVYSFSDFVKFQLYLHWFNIICLKISFLDIWLPLN
jgi:hypothetical protein